MAISGFLMGNYPDFKGFETFSYFFAAPWIIWTFALLSSA
jgi:hypothetical protein